MFKITLMLLTVLCFLGGLFAIATIMTRNLIVSTFTLILCYFFSAWILSYFHASFLTFVIIVVYLGALTVLFLFIVMTTSINFRNDSAVYNLIIGLIIFLVFNKANVKTISIQEQSEVIVPEFMLEGYPIYENVEEFGLWLYMCNPLLVVLLGMMLFVGLLAVVRVLTIQPRLATCSGVFLVSPVEISMDTLSHLHLILTYMLMFIVVVWSFIPGLTMLWKHRTGIFYSGGPPEVSPATTGSSGSPSPSAAPGSGDDDEEEDDPDNPGKKRKKKKKPEDPWATWKWVAKVVITIAGATVVIYFTWQYSTQIHEWLTLLGAAVVKAFWETPWSQGPPSGSKHFGLGYGDLPQLKYDGEIPNVPRTTPYTIEEPAPAIVVDGINRGEVPGDWLGRIIGPRDYKTHDPLFNKYLNSQAAFDILNTIEVTEQKSSLFTGYRGSRDFKIFFAMSVESGMADPVTYAYKPTSLEEYHQIFWEVRKTAFAALEEAKDPVEFRGLLAHYMVSNPDYTRVHCLNHLMNYLGEQPVDVNVTKNYMEAFNKLYDETIERVRR